MNNSISDKVQQRYKFVSTLSLGIVIFLILVGGIVRSTGSGMGCPDWPKCFGYSIPPTEVAQIEFQSGKSFKKGHMVIHHEALWKARRDFTAGADFSEADWEKYTKHDY
ncbi:MAG: COX15/CtaA family protein, partial [Bacteroidia bacterium]|nr:COX15/CtaA family protein [Bacteroidia bacterium]